MTDSQSPRLPGTEQTQHALRFPLLDLARFVAALLVVFFHWCFLFNIADPSVRYKPWLALEPYARYGYLGVNLFFLISGFLILQSAYLKTPAGFVRARITRLYPAYLACCALTYVIISLTASRYISLPSFAYNLTMMNGVIDSARGVAPTYVDGVYWTLAIEWKFYALMFLLIAAGQLARIEWFLWLWALACAGYTLHRVEWLDTYLIAAWGAYFVAGAAFYRSCAAGWNLSRAALVLVALGLCIVQARQFAADLAAVHGVAFEALVVTIVIASFFCFVAMLPIGARSMRRMIPRWTVTLGALSYPIYLLHQQIGAVVIQRCWSANTRYALLFLSFVGLIGLATVIHLGVERPTWTVLRRRGLARPRNP